VRKDPSEGFNPTEIDWARLAAYIDGEGSILMNRRNDRPHDIWLRVVICNTDPRMIVWLKQTFGGSVAVMRKPYKEGYKAQIKWHTSCYKAEWILRGCYQYLICKQDQADVAFAYRATTRGAGGHRGSPNSPELTAYRYELRDKLKGLRSVGKTNSDMELLRDQLNAKAVN
jgi:hypothetical protein